MKETNKKTKVFNNKKSYDEAVKKENNKISRSEDRIEELRRMLADSEKSAVKNSTKKKSSPPKQHTKVEVAYLDVYDYKKKLAIWRKNAGDNLTDQGCDKCHGKQYERTILLEDGRHICWFCWIRKPEGTESKKKSKKN